ncbi:hypothetical protein [Nocardiopsis sp. CC223A]|uniref:hypothetical protein n=1 Tax=Nocardiopsis sp. CC223A TaxID=3044051 RepID=UPI00278BD008|nr:hypothetical protein [Nocardiopsis sp. CC223A]
MSDGLIDPEAIPIPEANVYELQTAAAGMKTDGDDISQAGADISTAWAGLQGVYSAPEAETLFAATNPVPTKGEDTDQALNTAARALEDFAETAQRIRGELTALRAEARDLVTEIRSDEDWNSSEHPFDFVSEKGQEHDALLGKVNALVQEYQQAERDCANTITRTFGGTTFIGGDPAGTTRPGPGEVVYGLDEPLENVATPWGTPQGTDYYWTMDAALAAWDTVRGGAEDVGGMVGAFGEPGWFTDNWGANAEAYWGDALVGMGAWAGVYNPETGDWVGSFGEGFEVYTNARLDAVHGFFPWTELEERPGYAFGTLGTNLAIIGAGVALTATGGGAVVGVPLTVSRVVRIFGGVGAGDGPHLSAGDGSDTEGGHDRNGAGSGAHGNGAYSSSPSPSSPGEGAFSSDGEWKPSDIEDMNTVLSDLETAQNPSPAPEPAPAPRPESPTPEPRSEPVVPERAPDTATSDAPQQHTDQHGREADPTAQDVDQAFAEIAQNNEDLADRMDRQDGGRMAELDPDTAWTINPTQTTTEGGDGPGDGSRVPVTPDGAELREGNEATNNTDNEGPARQPGRDDNPITIHETEEQDLGGSSFGGPNDPPDIPNSGSSSSEHFPEPGVPTRENPTGPMSDAQESGIRDLLESTGLNKQKINDIIATLKDDDTKLGGQIADILLDNQVSSVKRFDEFVSDFSNQNMVPAAGTELRFVDNLISSGYPIERLEFAEKKDQEATSNSSQNFDIDTLIRSDGTSGNYAYQIKRLEVTDGAIRESALVNNTQKIGKQLRNIPLEMGETHTVGILEVNAPMIEISDKAMEKILANARRYNTSFKVYFSDGEMTFPEGSRVYP